MLTTTPHSTLLGFCYHINFRNIHYYRGDGDGTGVEIGEPNMERRIMIQYMFTLLLLLLNDDMQSATEDHHRSL